MCVRPLPDPSLSRRERKNIKLHFGSHTDLCADRCYTVSSIIVFFVCFASDSGDSFPAIAMSDREYSTSPLFSLDDVLEHRPRLQDVSAWSQEARNPEAGIIPPGHGITQTVEQLKTLIPDGFTYVEDHYSMESFPIEESKCKFRYAFW